MNKILIRSFNVSIILFIALTKMQAAYAARVECPAIDDIKRERTEDGFVYTGVSTGARHIVFSSKNSPHSHHKNIDPIEFKILRTAAKYDNPEGLACLYAINDGNTFWLRSEDPAAYNDCKPKYHYFKCK